MQPGSDAQRSPIIRRLCDLHDRVTTAGFALDVGCYLLAAVIFLSIPEMTRRGAHIHVNLIFDHLSPTVARMLRYAIGALAVAACLIATWITGSETWRQYSQEVWTLSALPIPKWWVSILIPYGLLSSALHFLRQLGRGAGETLLIGGAEQ
jgi:TRAP-type C4-dicarboxylate transport system permease small subunit